MPSANMNDWLHRHRHELSDATLAREYDRQVLDRQARDAGVFDRPGPDCERCGESEAALPTDNDGTLCQRCAATLGATIHGRRVDA